MAVREIDFDIPKGAIVSLIGPNGAGKTTFFNVVAGIFEPTSGHVEFLGNRVIARPHRGWLEPVLWFSPAVVVAVIGLAYAAAIHSERVGLLTGVVALGLLIAMMLMATIRTSLYQRLLDRVGIFRSARPNDMARIGLGRTFQNIRLFQNMTASENVLVGMHTRLRSTPLDAFLDTRAQSLRRGTRPGTGVRAARAGRPRRPGRRRGDATCPTATSAGWRWRVRSPASPRCCCSTSPRPA